MSAAINSDGVFTPCSVKHNRPGSIQALTSIHTKWRYRPSVTSFEDVNCQGRSIHSLTLRCRYGILTQYMNQRVKLPAQVAVIYRAVAELEAKYPGRKFTPDGHMVGSIGEVVAAEALGLRLHASSHPGHDACDCDGRQVQIKMTAGSSISLYSDCERLVVLKVINPEEAEIVYDGPGSCAWSSAGKMAKNGQRSISLSKLRAQRIEPSS